MMLSIATIPVLAFTRSDGSSDSKFEIFGPRVDRILIKKYSELDSEMNALLGGAIDITDWPLTRPWIDTLSLDANIRVLGYGGEAGYYTMSMNCNNNTYLGNPPDPAFPNPVKNATEDAQGNPTSDVWFRRALSYTIDPAGLAASLGGVYDPIYTPLPKYMEVLWIETEIAPGGLYEDLTYPWRADYANATALLNAHHFPIGGDGFRYYDMNENNVKDVGETIKLKFYSRADGLRRGAADQMAAGLLATHIDFVRQEVSSLVAKAICMVQKNYHLYTSGWIYIGPDPDYLYDLYSYDNYYHNGIVNPPNIAAIGKYDAVNEDLLHTLKYAPDQTTAQTACKDFQVNFADMAYEKPFGSASAPKAYNKWYTGGNDGVILGTDDGENQYRGDLWDQIVNQQGIGENAWWSTLSMYPVGHPYGDNTHMTVRYGWEQTTMPDIVNPIYSGWYWESELYGRVCDGGGARNPYTLGPVEVPQLLENWTIGTWTDPSDLQLKSRITVRMRPDVLWNDGVPVTIDDFIYTLVTLPGELRDAGCDDAWWQPTVDQVAGSFKLDNYTAEILMRVNSMFAVNWIVGNVILPQHFWHPFVTSNPPEDIQGDIGVGLIGTGPFLYTENVAGASATMLRNPLYYQQDEVGVIKEDPMSGINFVATLPSKNISPAKISDDVTGGTGGHYNIVVTVQNLNAYTAVTFSEKIEVRQIYPTIGAFATLYNNGAVNLASKATNVQTFARVDDKGVYEVKVTTQKAGGAITTHSKNVMVTVSGDVKAPFWLVDIFDLVEVAGVFGAKWGDPTSPPDPVYKVNADINHDGIIDIFDLVSVAGVFGWDP